MNPARRRLMTIVLVFVAPLVGCAATSGSLLAIPDDWENYSARHVGGGAHYGQPRLRTEGVWARDYAGLDALHLIEMRWSHSPAHHQGGLGSY